MRAAVERSPLAPKSAQENGSSARWASSTHLGAAARLEPAPLARNLQFAPATAFAQVARRCWLALLDEASRRVRGRWRGRKCQLDRYEARATPRRPPRPRRHAPVLACGCAGCEAGCCCCRHRLRRSPLPAQCACQLPENRAALRDLRSCQTRSAESMARGCQFARGPLGTQNAGVLALAHRCRLDRRSSRGHDLHELNVRSQCRISGGAPTT